MDHDGVLFAMIDFLVFMGKGSLAILLIVLVYYLHRLWVVWLQKKLGIYERIKQAEQSK